MFKEKKKKKTEKSHLFKNKYRIIINFKLEKYEKIIHPWSNKGSKDTVVNQVLIYKRDGQIKLNCYFPSALWFFSDLNNWKIWIDISN